MNIDTYSGDGTINSLGSWPFSKGFAVRLGAFSTAEVFQSTYNIANLPKSNKSYYIGLEIILPTTKYAINNIKNKIKGQLNIELESEEGVSIAEWQDDLINWNFSETSDGRFTRCFITPSHNGIDRNFFDYADIKQKGPLKIYVSFSPYEDSEKLRAEVLIETGGYL